MAIQHYNYIIEIVTYIPTIINNNTNTSTATTNTNTTTSTNNDNNIPFIEYEDLNIIYETNYSDLYFPVYKILNISFFIYILNNIDNIINIFYIIGRIYSLDHHKMKLMLITINDYLLHLKIDSIFLTE